jgi:hypothetical protein
MALSIYVGAANEFETALYEINGYLDFVSAAHHLRPRVGTMVDWATLDKDKSGALRGFVDQKEPHVEVGYNGLIIALGAAFEHLVRRLVKEAVLWINTKVDNYNGLPTPIRQQNLIRSGYALATVAEPPVESSYDYELLCRNLATCTSNGGTLVLNADAFSVSITNINEKRINESLSRISVSINWDVFGKNVVLRELFKSKAGRHTAGEVRKYLKEFVIRRNKIAHSGLGIRVSESDVRTAMSFFKAFAPALAEAVEVVLKKNHK